MTHTQRQPSKCGEQEFMPLDQSERVVILRPTRCSCVWKMSATAVTRKNDRESMHCNCIGGVGAARKPETDNHRRRSRNTSEQKASNNWASPPAD